MKRYAAPEVKSLDFMFETTCASSGQRCPKGKASPDPYNPDNFCIQCLQVNRKDKYYAEAPNHYSSLTWAADTAKVLIDSGECPVGF